MATQRRAIGKTGNLREELDALQRRGVVVARNPQSQRQASTVMANALSSAGSLKSDVQADAAAERAHNRELRATRFSAGATQAQHEHNMQQIASMRMSRAKGPGMHHTASSYDAV